MFRPAVTISALFALALAASPAAQSPTVSTIRLPEGGIQPQAAVDAGGITHVLYFKGEGAKGDLFYTRLKTNGTFGAPIRVNSQPGSAIATGTMRGGHLAFGRNQRVHVAWHGSGDAAPKAPGNQTPVMYSRMNDAGTAFEPQRNVVQTSLTGLDGGTVAADANGNVYVAWHAFEPGLRGEADRRVWIARSSDDGRTFAAETAASPAATGACGCCAVGAMTSRTGRLHLLYRAATENVHRDTYLLSSTDKAATFNAQKLQEWNVASCPMSTYTMIDTPAGVLAAWETDGQVYWTRVDATTGAAGPVIGAPGSAGNRKHPVLAANSRGQVLLAWTEGTGWNKGGGLAWQLFDAAGQPTADSGRAPGLPTWSLAAVAARADGRFAIIF